MKTFLTSATLLLIFISILSSCKKEEPVNYMTLAEDATATESAFNDVFRVVDDESKNGQYQGTVGKTMQPYVSHIDTCAIVTLNTNGGNFPMTLTIDFGSGCTDAYGVVRKGKIICVYSGQYRDAGSTVTITTDNYYVNDFKVEGTEIITNNGRNNNGNLEFSVAVSNGKITKPNGGIITWQSERTNEWAEGESTTFLNGITGICDDVYFVSGFGEGTTSDGHDYRIVITSPLKKQICCYWVSQGSIILQVDGVQLAGIDYGDGTCNPNANLTYGGNTFVFIIR
ncbi:MAG TPA: hypothetical protein VNJ07_05260 [Chitinophagales bacterium]|nr:hypothetical protein [Chitinophagales bacterium]